MLVGPAAHGQIRASRVGVCNFENSNAWKRVIHRDGHRFPERWSDACKDRSGAWPQLIPDRPAFLLLQGEVRDIAAGYTDELGRGEIADDGFLPGPHGHHAAVHVAVKFYADVRPSTRAPSAAKPGAPAQAIRMSGKRVVFLGIGRLDSLALKLFWARHTVPGDNRLSMILPDPTPGLRRIRK